MGGGVAGGAQEAELEALKAAGASFGHIGDADWRFDKFGKKSRVGRFGSEVRTPGRFDRLSDRGWAWRFGWLVSLPNHSDRGGGWNRRDLQTADKGEPGGVIIFIINRFQTVGGGIAAKLVTADGIFIERNDVGVAEEYSGAQALADHPFDDGGRAGGAAAVQQDAVLRQVAALRRLRHKAFFMNMRA